MTEVELHNLLNRAVLRMRSSAALMAALRALGASMIAMAAGVCWMRWSGRELIGVAVVSALPFALTACVGVLAFLFARPAVALAAALLDRRAETAEHLTTWLFLCGLDDAKLSETQRGFRAAQRQAALRAADSIHLKSHLPIVLPAWSRAIWLAMILLLSAILMPPNRPDAIQTPDRSPGIGLSAEPGGGSGGKKASETLRETPRVQVLAPAHMRKLELIATDPELSASVKNNALKELNDAIAGVPESELTPDVRQLLDLLRKDTAALNPAPKADGSIQVGSTQEAAKTVAGPVKPAEYKAYENVEQAWASSESEFGDVRERLARYYGKAR